MNEFPRQANDLIHVGYSMHIKQKVSQLMVDYTRESVHNSSIRHNRNRWQLQSFSGFIESDFGENSLGAAILARNQATFWLKAKKTR